MNQSTISTTITRTTTRTTTTTTTTKTTISTNNNIPQTVLALRGPGGEMNSL